MIDLNRISEILKILPQALYQSREYAFELEKAYAKAGKMTSVITGMPTGSGGSHSNVENGAIRVDEIKEAYKEAFEELVRLQSELIPIIDKVKDEQDRAILRLRYIQGKTDAEIAEAIGYEVQSVWRRRRAAEKKILAGG